MNYRTKHYRWNHKKSPSWHQQRRTDHQQHEPRHDKQTYDNRASAGPRPSTSARKVKPAPWHAEPSFGGLAGLQPHAAAPHQSRHEPPASTTPALLLLVLLRCQELSGCPPVGFLLFFLVLPRLCFDWRRGGGGMRCIHQVDKQASRQTRSGRKGAKGADGAVWCFVAETGAVKKRS